MNTQELQLNNIKNNRNKREYFETVRNNFVQEEDESNLEESGLERTFVNPVYVNMLLKTRRDLNFHKRRSMPILGKPFMKNWRATGKRRKGNF